MEIFSANGDAPGSTFSGESSSLRMGVVYVPATAKSSANLAIGLQQGVWGFKDEAMDRSTYLQDFRLLREGDMVFLGHGGPSPRVPKGGWAEKRLQRGYPGLVTRVEEGATRPVWPDDTYPYRLHIDFLPQRRDFDAAGVGEATMEALRLSANQQGRVVVLSLGGAPTVAPGPLAESLTLDGPLDRAVTRVERREQEKLRRQRLGSAVFASCDLCARSFPVRYLRMAHIKKRSLCTDVEKRDPNVVMTACIECDALFESGELIVDAGGVIRAAVRTDVTADLEALLEARVGLRCGAFTEVTNKYFEFHRAGSA